MGRQTEKCLQKGVVERWWWLQARVPAAEMPLRDSGKRRAVQNWEGSSHRCLLLGLRHLDEQAQVRRLRLLINR